MEDRVIVAIRKASKAPFPYDSNDICYLVIRDCLPHQLRKREDVLDAITNQETIYGAWPGATRTDLFVIDEPFLLRDALRNE